MKRTTRTQTGLAAAFGALTLLSACGGGGDSGSSASTTTGTLAALPKATGPVSGSSSSSIGSLATTGLALKSWGSSALWNSSSKSRAMCETGLLVRDALSEAMSPDKIACYLGAIQKSGGFSSDIATGSYVYVKLQNMPGDASNQPRIKMKIVKSGGAITGFEMFSCFAANGATQSEYFNQTISSGSVSMISKNIGSDSGNTYGSKCSVSGTVDSSYAWTSKSLSVERLWDGTANSNGSFSQAATITQRASSLIVNGYQKGTFGNGATANIFTNKFYTVAQLLNASTPKNLALGDGSGKYSMDWCIDSNSNGNCTGEGTAFAASGTDAWTGDDRLKMGTPSSSTYYTEANAGSLPSSTPTVSVTFDTAEQWNCSLPSEYMTVDLSNMADTSTALGAAMAACDDALSYRNDTGATDGYPCGDAR